MFSKSRIPKLHNRKRYNSKISNNKPWKLIQHQQLSHRTILYNCRNSMSA